MHVGMFHAVGEDHSFQFWILSSLHLTKQYSMLFIINPQ